eukprot:scaffold80322_cov26-Tisochrysis_lutea.AAC.1
MTASARYARWAGGGLRAAAALAVSAHLWRQSRYAASVLSCNPRKTLPSTRCHERSSAAVEARKQSTAATGAPADAVASSEGAASTSSSSVAPARRWAESTRAHAARIGAQLVGVGAPSRTARCMPEWRIIALAWSTSPPTRRNHTNASVVSTAKREFQR